MRDQAGEPGVRDNTPRIDQPVASDVGLADSGLPDTAVETALASEPADATAEDEVLPANESLPLGGQGSSSGLSFFSGGDSNSQSYDAGGSGWVINTLAALGVVIGLVFLIRWVLRRGGVVSTAAPRSSVVEVLSRTTVAPRSHVVLMRVGQRVLVVSDSPAGMRTLASVHDPEEVADLLGSIDASAPASMTSGFQGAMSKLSSQWSDNAADDDALAGVPAEDDLSMDRTRGALSSLRGRLATLSKAGGAA